MKRFLVLSDIHVPVYQRDIPKVIYEISKEFDGIIALGDFTNLDTVLTLESLNVNFHGVSGNMDDFEVKMHLLERKVLRLEGLVVGLIHGWGPPYDIIERIYKKFLDTEVDLVIFGHTHQPISTVYSGVSFLNPGSATPGGSYGILTIDGRDFEFQVQRL